MAETLFVGRDGERERLAGVLRGDPGSAAAALVTGDAGIGKSRLLAEVARAVPDVAVLTGSCLPMSESLPYGAITDAIDHLTGPTGRPVLDKALSRWFADAHLSLLGGTQDGHEIAPWNKVLCAAATAHGFLCADVSRAFNGPNGLRPSGELLREPPAGRGGGRTGSDVLDG